jgi:hypothetical protein
MKITLGPFYQVFCYVRREKISLYFYFIDYLGFIFLRVNVFYNLILGMAQKSVNLGLRFFKVYLSVLLYPYEKKL